MALPSATTRPYRLILGDPAAVRMRATRSPQLAVKLLPATCADGRQRPLAANLPLRPSARAAWAALSMPGLDRYPDCLTPIDALDEPVSAGADRLRALPGRALSTEIDTLWGGKPPAPWRYAAEHPRAWLDSLADATVDAWAAMETRWRRGDALLDREIARIGVATVTGTLDALLNSLHPRLHYRDGCLDFETDCNTCFVLGDRQLVLIPTLLGNEQLCVSFDQAGLAFIAYPARGLRAASPPRENPGDDALGLVLGPIRAQALRHLDRARTMRQLAIRLHCAASTATYHCDQLEAAGLITRDRQAQSVWVTRTERADELIELLDGDPARAARLA